MQRGHINLHQMKSFPMWSLLSKGELSVTQFGVCCHSSPFVCHFPPQWETELEATMRVGKWHILGPKSHVSIASLVARILTVAIEIWNHECGPFWPNFPVFTIVYHIRTTISPRATESSQNGVQK